MSEFGPPSWPRFLRVPAAMRLLAWKPLVPILIVGATVLVAGVILLQERDDRSMFRANISEENSLRMQMSVRLVEEYFDSVYYTLLAISRNNDVMAMRRDSQSYIRQLYQYQWEQHRMAEVYLVENDLSGKAKPFMTFYHDAQEMRDADAHLEELDKDEYEVEIQQMREFAAPSTFRAQLSKEIPLCILDPSAKTVPGFVYSVPVRSGDSLAGLVAGMIPTRAVANVLGTGLKNRVAFLINERGDVMSPEGADPAVLNWFKQECAAKGAEAFFSKTNQGVGVVEWVALWSPVRIVADTKWWLVYLHPESDYQPKTWLAGWSGHFTVAGSLLGMGLALGFLVRTLGLRLDEQVERLRERRQMEREIQEVSEREQRRFGESLNEDLCQRLFGIEATSKLLEKQLASTGFSETSVASEIAGEVHGALVAARRMANELHPVALLEHGLVAALEELAANTRHRAGISCHLEDRGFPEKLDSFLANHLYRIAQEAIDNAVRHAQTQKILITLAAQNGDLELGVRDNGVGIPESAERRPGMGLRIMRYRAELIGATLEIHRAEDRGTILLARFPKPSNDITPPKP